MMQCLIQRVFGHSLYMIHKILLVERRRPKAFKNTDGMFNAVIGLGGLEKVVREL